MKSSEFLEKNGLRPIYLNKKLLSKDKESINYFKLNFKQIYNNKEKKNTVSYEKTNNKDKNKVIDTFININYKFRLFNDTIDYITTDESESDEDDLEYVYFSD